MHIHDSLAFADRPLPGPVASQSNTSLSHGVSVACGVPGLARVRNGRVRSSLAANMPSTTLYSNRDQALGHCLAYYGAPGFNGRFNWFQLCIMSSGQTASGLVLSLVTSMTGRRWFCYHLHSPTGSQYPPHIPNFCPI
jgi:hypothetical protein